MKYLAKKWGSAGFQMRSRRQGHSQSCLYLPSSPVISIREDISMYSSVVDVTSFLICCSSSSLLSGRHSSCRNLKDSDDWKYTVGNGSKFLHNWLFTEKYYNLIVFESKLCLIALKASIVYINITFFSDHSTLLGYNFVVKYTNKNKKVVV